jgi:DNA excision repair protein ERCC-4
MARPTIICDTREQKPYSFSSRMTTVRRALVAGDYSIEGMETSVAIERKSLEDYVGSVIGDRERFQRELAKLWGYKYAWIIVEGCVHDVLAGNWHGGALPSSVMSATVDIMARWGIPVLLAGDRATAERLTESLLLKVHSIGSP